MNLLGTCCLFHIFSHILSCIVKVRFQELKPAVDTARCQVFLLQVKDYLFAVWLLGSWRKFKMLILPPTVFHHSALAWVSSLHLLSQVQPSCSVRWPRNAAAHHLCSTSAPLHVRSQLWSQFCEQRFRTDPNSVSATSKSKQKISNRTSVAMETFPSFFHAVWHEEICKLKLSSTERFCLYR